MTGPEVHWVFEALPRRRRRWQRLVQFLLIAGCSLVIWGLIIWGPPRWLIQ